MGRTTVEAFVTGERGTRRFNFLVDTGSTFVGLPLEEIEALGLPKIPGGALRLITALGVTENEAYGAGVRIGDDRTAATVVVTPIPLIGYEVLENLRMKVNPVTQQLERAPEDELMPPYVL